VLVDAGLGGASVISVKRVSGLEVGSDGVW
jgi:hypothetical protein